MRSIRGTKPHLQSERKLQKVDIISSISGPQTTAAPSDPLPLQQDPLPFQQSQQLCPGTNVYGYTSIRALRDDLSVYFQIIHGVPPPPGEATTPGTAIPPPVFGTTDATNAVTAVGSTDSAGSGATSIAGIVSTTGATATDTLFSTTAAAVTTAAVTPVVRKRSRSHEHRGLQDASVVDNATVWEAATTGMVDDTTGVNATITNVDLGDADSNITVGVVDDTTDMNVTFANVDLGDADSNITVGVVDNTTDVNVTIANLDIGDADSNLTVSLSTVAFGEESNETTTVDEPPIQAETTPGPELSVDFEIEPSIPVQFNVCSGEYNFDSLIDKDPLVLEALTHNPMWIRCAAVADDDGAGCIFSGGQHHISFNNHGSASNTTEEQVIHPLTISGMSFQKAAVSAISMHDPRGEIVLDSCEFTENKGAAMVINGRYSGTHTAYYDYEVDEEILVDEVPNGGGGGGGNPIISDGGDSTEDDLLQQFYEDVFTPAPITANPSPAPNTEPTTEAPITPYPTTALRIPLMPTFSPAPSVSANILNPIPEKGGYTGPPTFAPDETETSSTEESFLLPTTTGTGTTAFVNPSTTWAGDLGSTTTTQSTPISTVDTDDFLAGGDTDSIMDDGFRREQSRTRDENRVLEVDNHPKSIIKILSCLFRSNTGSATILMNSHHGEMETIDAGVLGQTDDVFNAAAGIRADVDVPMVHSIHLMLEQTMFDSENVKRSVIINDGGRLQTSDVIFISNTADSIIHAESATIAMSQTEFSDNTITGDTGLVEMDNESMLESNENNCDSSETPSAVAPVSFRFLQELTSTSEGDTGSEETVLVASSDAGPSSGCAGIYSNGMCRQFPGNCDAQSDEVVAEVIEGCVSTWDELVTAVSERLDDERDFIICPQSTLDIDTSTSKAPVVIDSDYITIKCGETGSLSDECAIVGGVTQFEIIGSAPGIELAGLRMLSSRGSSIVAAGSKDSTLILKNCEWMSHVGESVILIHSETAVASEANFDMTQLMSINTEGAMAVEIRNCIFRKNTLIFGTISNIGGTVTVYETLFDGNFAKGGDIVLTNSGSGKIQGSCFDASSSTAPGTVFVEFGSTMSVNTDNFGINNTSVGEKCNAIFQESEGTSCLSNSAKCDGSCVDFTGTTCTLPMYDKFIDGPVSSTPVSAPILGENAPPHALGDVTEPQTSNNLIPIVVATIVSAFVVFGLAGIVWHRKKRGKGASGGAESERGTSRFASLSFASFRGSNQLQEEELKDAYDGFDDLDEDDM